MQENEMTHRGPIEIRHFRPLFERSSWQWHLPTCPIWAWLSFLWVKNMNFFGMSTDYLVLTNSDLESDFLKEVSFGNWTSFLTINFSLVRSSSFHLIGDTINTCVALRLLWITRKRTFYIVFSSQSKAGINAMEALLLLEYVTSDNQAGVVVT